MDFLKPKWKNKHQHFGAFKVMAENKKSFVLYSDQRSIIDMLPDELAGQLIKHIYAYVNDENPVNDNPMVNLAFEPIKLQLKRDLQRWEETKEGRSKAGKASAEARRNKIEQQSTNLTNVDFVQQTSTNSTVNVNDNVNVNDILLIKETKDIIKPKFDFKKSLLDLGIDEIVVDTFLKVRKKKKAVNSELAFTKISNEIIKSGLTPNEAITIAAEKSWSGFESDWVKEKNFAQKKENPTMRSTNEAFDQAKKFILNGGVINQ